MVQFIVKGQMRSVPPGDTSGNRLRNKATNRRADAIMHAAALLFAQNSYDGTSIKDLEEAVGLGRGALYYHISSKQNLLYEISKQHVVEMVQAGEEILSRPIPADEKLVVLARRLTETIAANLPELTVFFADYRALAPAYREELQKLRDRFEVIWQTIIQEGSEEGLFRTLDPIVVKGILGLYNYSYLWLDPEGRLSPGQLADIFSDLILTGLKK